MLCYAWDVAELLNKREIGSVDRDAPVDFLALELARLTNTLLRRGLERAYLAKTEVTQNIRGKISITESLKVMSSTVSKLTCEYDELSPASLANRIIRSTLHRLHNSQIQDKPVNDTVSSTLGRFPVIPELYKPESYIDKVIYHRNNHYYRAALGLCELILLNLIPDPKKPGGWRFLDFREDANKMWKIFESFVRSFFDREQNGYRVTRRSYGWRNAVGHPRTLAVLPELQTDIVLTSSQRIIIIDTKYYKNPLDERHGNFKLNREHLSQIITYVDNCSNPLNLQLEGILLYAAAGENFDYRFSIDGRRLRAVTLNLNQTWHQIKEDLLSIACS
jgi:5-methylcytosine-specific restriction enzyme subunit McrC